MAYAAVVGGVVGFFIFYLIINLGCPNNHTSHIKVWGTKLFLLFALADLITSYVYI